MSEQEIREFVELLIPYIKRELKKDKDFKINVKRKNATVVTGGADNSNIEVRLPYDSVTFFVPNKTGEELLEEDLICIEYSIDLKNAVAVYKVN